MNSPMLLAKSLKKSYGERLVVKDFSLSLEASSITSLVGPNGAGKTTAVGMMYGVVIPDAGSVEVLGINMLTDGARARAKVGVVTQEDNLDPDLTVRENLVTFARHHRILGAEAKARVDELISRAELGEYQDALIDDLSGGLRRRVVLARAVIHRPNVVFLDEPTTGLDPDARQELWRLMQELRAEGAAIVLTTHYLEEAERLSDEVILLSEGEILRTGTPRELIESIVGSLVIEIEGIDQQGRESLYEISDWNRPVGMGFAIGVSEERLEQVRAMIRAFSPSRVVERKAQLDDVYFMLTLHD